MSTIIYNAKTIPEQPEQGQKTLVHSPYDHQPRRVLTSVSSRDALFIIRQPLFSDSLLVFHWLLPTQPVPFLNLSPLPSIKFIEVNQDLSY